MKTNALSVLVLAGAIVATGCGGGGGGTSGASSGTSSISGNITDSSVAAPRAKSWLAWLVEEAIGVVDKAYAARNGVGGITVTARNDARETSSVTDDSGDFDLDDAPTGDVTVTFDDGDCSSDVEVPDVVEGSTLELEDVNVDCDGATPGRVTENFQGVVRNKPNSPNGNLVVCVSSGDRVRTRVVKVHDAAFEDGSFDELEEGDLIEVSGERSGEGAPSALNGDSVRILSHDSDFCETGVLPTPTPEPTPEPTPTPEGTEEPTPEPTEEPTPEPTPSV